MVKLRSKFNNGERSLRRKETYDLPTIQSTVVVVGIFCGRKKYKDSFKASQSRIVNIRVITIYFVDIKYVVALTMFGNRW